MVDASIEQPTVGDRPSRVRSASTPGTAAMAPRSPADVLYANEIKRGRVWVGLCGYLAIAALVAVLLVDAPLRARILLTGTAVVLGGASAITLWILRDEARYSRRLAVAFCIVNIVCMLPAYYFLGWASMVTLLVPLGGITLGMGQERPVVIAIGAATAGTHALFALATIFGVIDAPGVVGPGSASRLDQLLFLLFIEGVVVASYWMGRLLRAHSLEAVERFGDLVRDAARREALLQEALRELDDARHAGDVGRFTGMTLGSFQLGEVIGRGAMGEVYEAVRADGAGVAAVKVMTRAGTGNPRAVERFDREIRIAASLESPHLPRVYEHSAPTDPIKYLAMERLVGQPLSDVIREHAMAPRDALALFDQIAWPIDLAHGAGIVHRDLKPRNLFRHDQGGRRSLWKVLDFGVSKLADSDGTLTAGGIVGTPGYMAPEQATAGAVDARADLFALGAIAYRVLVGRPAFPGGDTAAILYAVVHTMPARPSANAPVPREIDLVLAIALAKRPEDRFASARELADALAAAYRGDLPDELRRRGEALVALYPWGR